MSSSSSKNKVNNNQRKLTPLPRSRISPLNNKSPTKISAYKPPIAINNSQSNFNPNGKLSYSNSFSSNKSNYNYNTNYNNNYTNNNYANNYNNNYYSNRDYKLDQNKYHNKSPSFGLFNYLESPFYVKKMNDPGNRKYRNKLNKQYAYRKKMPIIPTSALFLTASSAPKSSIDLDYKLNYNYLNTNSVIPPTEDALQEYNRQPIDLTDIPPPSSFQNSYINDNIETIFTNKPLPNYTGLTSEEARQALIKYASNNYCLNKSYAKKCSILNIENSFIYTISLETFSEKRQTSWAYEPYTGGYIDNNSNGPTPNVWDIVPSYDNVKPFRINPIDHVECIVIPHSETIRSCFLCKSSGKIKCEACHGAGYDRCYAIQHKIDNGEPCYQCEGGAGRKKCFNCNGYGVVNCKICLSSGQLKCFLKLTITWKNHIDEYLPESVIPKEKLRFTSGDIIYNDTNVKVTPISYVTNKDLSKASEILLRKHEESYLTQERCIMQRQLIQVIQVANVTYQYRNKLGIFFVYGKEAKVFAPQYPKNFLSCCSCCTII